MSSDSPEFFVVLASVGGKWEEVDNVPRYRNASYNNYRVKFPSNISFYDFYTLVKKKTRMSGKKEVSLSFQHPEHNYVMNIVDDDDLGYLISVIQEFRKASPVNIFVFEMAEEQQISAGYDQDMQGSGKNATQLHCSGKGSNEPTNASGTIIATTVPQYNIIDPFCPVQNPIQYPVEYVAPQNTIQYVAPDNTMQYPMQYPMQFPMQNPIEYAALENIQFVGDDVGAYFNTNFTEQEPFEIDRINDEEEINTEYNDIESAEELNENCRAFNDSSSSSDEELPVDDHPKSIDDTIFYGMPPVPPCPVVDKGKYVSHNLHRNQRIKELQVFKDKEKLVLAIGQKFIEENKEYFVSKSTKSRFEVKCRQEKCTWRIRATVIKDTGGMFQVRKLTDEHTCSNSQFNPKHHQGSKKVLGHIIANVLKGDYSRNYRGSDIVHDLNARYNLNITYNQAWRGKRQALEILQGSHEESFSHLPAYFYNLKKHNPGTVAYIRTDDDDRFEHLFFALGCSVRSFRKYCRPVVVVDGAHLKGEFKGTILLAAGMDGQNQILPIAFGVSKNESTESWTWFFQKLHECIGDMQDLAIVSDRAQSIQTSIRNVFPQAFHGICGYHLYANVASRFGRKNKKLRDMFWRACKAYTVGEHEDAMRALHGKYDKAWSYLKGIEPEKWTRSHFPANRYSFMTSNSAESLNTLSKNARKMPVLMLVEFFRETMQKWSYNHRNFAAEMTTTLTRWADLKVGKKKNRSTNWNVYPIDNLRFEVKEFTRNVVVNFSEKTCDCRVWQVLGLPCAHVMKVLVSKGYSDCAQYAKEFYLADTLRGTYAEVVNPLPAPGDWEIPEGLMTVKAPVMARRQPGRPKNTDRIPSQGESPIKKECTACGGKGHTRTNCTSLRFKGDSAGSSKSGKPPGRGISGNSGGSVSGSQSEFVYPTVDLKTHHM